MSNIQCSHRENSMFKPIRMLQVGTVMCLVAGCASGNTPNRTVHADNDAITVVQTEPDPAPEAGATATQSLPPLTRSDPAPSIQAGTSTASASGFMQEDGTLKADIQAYANEVALTRNIPQETVESLLTNAQYNAQAARLMSPSTTRVRRSWVTYRDRFVEPVRLRAGIEFWQQHQQQLERVEQEYGVPAAVIVAIIGVETIYGRYTGDFRVLDALATLGFRYPDPSRPERSQLFRDQLADLIQLHHERKLDAYTVEGSFAGAMGLPQFMPGSLLRYAVDGDGDGHINLHHNPADAIASVAAFLRHHGWIPGLPIFAPVQLPEHADALVHGGIDPSLTWHALEQDGATARPHTHSTEWKNYKLGVIDLKDEPRNTVEFRTGTPNFFAITHYNRSYFYATAVTELAEELTRKMGAG